MPQRQRCAHCGQNKAHAYCTIYHCWFHDTPRNLPEGSTRLIAIPNGVNSEGKAKHLLVENNCFHEAHRRSRIMALAGSTTTTTLQITQQPFNRCPVAPREAAAPASDPASAASNQANPQQADSAAANEAPSQNAADHAANPSSNRTSSVTPATAARSSRRLSQARPRRGDDT